jgi:hypothetical protein
MTALRDPLTQQRPAVDSGRRGWLPWAILAIVMGAVALVANSPWLSVSEIEVVGSIRSETRARIATSGVGEGALLLWVDTGAIERAVRADPWVRDVRVSKVWPDRLVVEVAERRPLLWIEGILGWMLVAADGTVVDRAPEPEAGLLRASVALPDVEPGVRPVDPGWHEIVQMALVVEDALGGTMVLEMRGAEMWTEVLGHPVRLGHPIDLADKARTLLAMIGQQLPVGAVIDITSPARPAVVDNPEGDVEGSGEES